MECHLMAQLWGPALLDMVDHHLLIQMTASFPHTVAFPLEAC